MRYIKIVLFIVVSVVYNKLYSQEYDVYGEGIKEDGVISISSVLDNVTGEASMDVKFSATVTSVCQMKGCWMKVENSRGADVRVTFKDYGFFVPKDIASKEVIVSGIIQRVVLSEEDAKHYAEDEGVPYDPNKEYVEFSVVADGVLVGKD